MIKVVCFDLDGVFFKRVHEGIIDLLVKKFNLDKAQVENVMFLRSVSEGGYNEIKLGKKSDIEYWEWFSKALGLTNYSLANYIDDLQSCYQINEQAVKLIEKLHKQGIKTAICSNNYRSNIDGLKQKFNLDKYFDIQVYSYEVGSMKPESEIYKTLVNMAQVAPDEIMLSDDNANKLEGAIKLGIRTFVYTDFDQFLMEIRNSGVTI